MTRLVNAARRRRLQARRVANASVASPRYAALLAELERWLDAQHAHLQPEVGLAQFAAGIVRKRHKRLLRDAAGLVHVAGEGSCEADSLSPVGEYAMSCLGRERIFQHFSRAHGTPTALIRLNYACDLRYGVLVDLARSVWEGRPVDLRMSHFNTIWQGDANALTLTALGHVASPAWIVNVTGTEKLSVREICKHFGCVMNRPVEFTDWEEQTALLSDCSLSLRTLGTRLVSMTMLVEWVAAWVMSGGRTLGKPTHFESRDGRF